MLDSNSCSFLLYFLQISGHGLALAGVPIEQDSAYWEAHVTDLSGTSTTDQLEVWFGVASKKDRQFYKALEEETGTCENGDVSSVETYTAAWCLLLTIAHSVARLFNVQAHWMTRALTICDKSKSKKEIFLE
jgi:hypothetical protein